MNYDEGVVVNNIPSSDTAQKYVYFKKYVLSILLSPFFLSLFLIFLGDLPGMHSILEYISLPLFLGLYISTLFSMFVIIQPFKYRSVKYFLGFVSFILAPIILGVLSWGALLIPIICFVVSGGIPALIICLLFRFSPKFVPLMVLFVFFAIVSVYFSYRERILLISVDRIASTRWEQLEREVDVVEKILYGYRDYSDAYGELQKYFKQQDGSFMCQNILSSSSKDSCLVRFKQTQGKLIEMVTGRIIISATDEGGCKVLKGLPGGETSVYTCYTSLLEVVGTEAEQCRYNPGRCSMIREKIKTVDKDFCNNYYNEAVIFQHNGCLHGCSIKRTTPNDDYGACVNTLKNI